MLTSDVPPPIVCFERSSQKRSSSRTGRQAWENNLKPHHDSLDTRPLGVRSLQPLACCGGGRSELNFFDSIIEDLVFGSHVGLQRFTPKGLVNSVSRKGDHGHTR